MTQKKNKETLSELREKRRKEFEELFNNLDINALDANGTPVCDMDKRIAEGYWVADIKNFISQTEDLIIENILEEVLRLNSAFQPSYIAQGRELLEITEKNGYNQALLDLKNYLKKK